MEDEIEDLVGDVKYTDSQKSVATSNVYSLDFTDCSSDQTEQNYSSGKETYVIERYDSDDSDKTFQTHNQFTTPVKLNHDVNIQFEPFYHINKSTTTSLQKYSILAQEMYTQTSKTIIELATVDTALKSTNNTLETQTSFISIMQNKTIEYKIELSDEHTNLPKNKIKEINSDDNDIIESYESPDFAGCESENDQSQDISGSQTISFSEKDSKDNILSEEQNEGQYESTSDFDEDSLMDHKTPNESVDQDSDGDLSDLVTTTDNDLAERSSPVSVIHGRCFRALSTLTEESAAKEELVKTIDMSFDSTENKSIPEDIIFINNGINIKLLPQEDAKLEVKLPPIHVNHSCPTSPHLNYLFCVSTPQKVLSKAGTLPCLHQRQRDRWELATKQLASGESVLINSDNDYEKQKTDVQLPPIHIEGQFNDTRHKNESKPKNKGQINFASPSIYNSISIENRIRELKWNNKHSKSIPHRLDVPLTESKTSRSGSPRNAGEYKLGDIEARGCEVLCAEVLRRLRSNSWVEIADTLEDTPRVLERFWGIISEQRIADLIRQVSTHVESPRMHVARTACNTLASIVKNTNYTKKPDFYEAVTVLLVKTGSYNRPVRRAANMALDEIACGVELTHAVTAFCVHGVDHKNQHVRCATARLLVVACALAGGGRDLLRGRPSSAATARRHGLQALATLLDDKYSETRKYAERLYSMLRPLDNFEAYYLTDVHVDVASRQMKKYDQLLLCSPLQEAR